MAYNLTVFMFGQVPAGPPNDFTSWLQSLLYVVGIVAIILIALNNLITLYDRVRGKQAPQPGYSNVTQSELEKVIEPMVTAASKHEERDSDRFEKVNDRQDKLAEVVNKNFGVLFRQMERLNTILRMKGVHIPLDDGEDDDGTK